MQELSLIRFYDEECGDAYVTTASEIAYRPSALTLLDRLSAACERLQQELGKRLTDNKQQRPAMPLLPRIVELPSLRYFLATLFVPQTSSTPEDPHPLIVGLLRAATQNRR